MIGKLTGLPPLHKTTSETTLVNPVLREKPTANDKRKRKPRKQPLLRPTEPKLRITADASAAKPQRFSYGYIICPGTARVLGEVECPKDRSLIVDNWLGSNEQALFACAKGIGIHGSRVAEAALALFPAELQLVSYERTRRKAAKVESKKVAPLNPDSHTTAERLFNFVAKHSTAPLHLETPEISAKPVVDSAQRLCETMQTALSRLTRRIQATSDVDCTESGAQLVTVLVRNRTVVVGHVGACRAVIAREVDAMDVAHSNPAILSTTNNITEIQDRRGAITRVSRLNTDVSVVELNKMHKAPATALAHTALDRVYSRAPEELSDAGASLAMSTDNSSTSRASRSAASLRSHSVSMSRLPTAKPQPNRAIPRPTAATSEILGDFMPTGSSKRESMARKREALCASNSMPSFPDLPREIETVLGFPHETYVKPSSTYALTKAAALERRREMFSASLKQQATVSIDAEDDVPKRQLHTLQTLMDSELAVDYSAPPPGWERSRLGKAVEHKFESMHILRDNVLRMSSATPYSHSPTASLRARPTSRVTFGNANDDDALNEAARTAASAIRTLERGFAALDEQVSRRAALTTGLSSMIKQQYGDSLPTADISDDTAAQRRLEFMESARGRLSESMVEAHVSSGQLAVLALQRGLNKQIQSLGRPTSAARRFASLALPDSAGTLLHPPSSSSSRGEKERGYAPLPRSILSMPSLSASSDDTQTAWYGGDGHPITVTLPVAASMDHRPDRPEEWAVIAAAGGRVALPAGARQGYRGNLPKICAATGTWPGLSVSRCIGCTAAESVGLRHEAEVFSHTLQPSDRFIIIASEGLWSVVSSEEAVSIAHKVTKRVMEGGSAKTSAEDLLPNTATTADMPAKQRILATPSSDSPLKAKILPKSSARNRISTAVNPPRSAQYSDVYHSSLRHTLTTSESMGSSVIIQVPSLTGDVVDIDRIAQSDPTSSVLHKCVAPEVYHPCPTDHSTRPGVECQVGLSADAGEGRGLAGEGRGLAGEGRGLAAEGGGVLAGFGGGSEDAMDLLESLVDPDVLKQRTQRRRLMAFAASEALLAVARTRWRQMMADKGTSLAGLHDDISVIVVYFEP